MRVEFEIVSKRDGLHCGYIILKDVSEDIVKIIKDKLKEEHFEIH